MEARIYRAALFVAAFFALGASYRTPNFVITAPTAEFAKQVGDSAEKYRRELALLWIGKELPRWGEPCPIFLQVGPSLGAGGATSFVFDRGEVFGWHMSIQGTPERLLDSVLPHEVTHTIFASYFRRPLPRWADEGACTTVEHEAERRKQQQMLVQFLQTGRGIPFSKMFMMREYPSDVMPLYSQGYSLCRYLIQQGGRKKFVDFISEGMRGDQWAAVTKRYYGYNRLADLQTSWVDWVRNGSPKLDIPNGMPEESGTVLVSNDQRQRPQPNLIYRGQSADSSSAPNATLTPASAPAEIPSADQLAAADFPTPPQGPTSWSAAEEPSQPKTSTLSYPKDNALATSQRALPAPVDNRVGSRSDNRVEARPTSAPAAENPREVLLEWSRPAETQPQGNQPAATPPANQNAAPRRAPDRQAGNPFASAGTITR